MAKKRLSKALAAAGIASRRASEEIITSGRVSVNGQTVYLPQTLVDWEQDDIFLDGKPIQGEQEKVYYLLNKPSGYVCTNAKFRNVKRVVDLFEKEGSRLFTVGRLDKDTTGLLLVTNDGHFANRVMHPSFNIEKEYVVKVDREVTAEHLVALSQGTVVEGVFIKPVSVKKVRRGTLKVVIMEGKKREIRQLVEGLNFKVLELKRVRIGQLILGQVPVGSYRPLTDKEKQLLIKHED